MNTWVFRWWMRVRLWLFFLRLRWLRRRDPRLAHMMLVDAAENLAWKLPESELRTQYLAQLYQLDVRYEELAQRERAFQRRWQE